MNLHGSWLIGLALFVLYILCGSFEFKKGAIEQEHSQAPSATVCSPCWRVRCGAAGKSLWLASGVESIDMMTNQKLNIANVSEWKPLDLSTVAGACAFGAICLMIVASAFKGRKWRVYELAFVFFAWYAALDHMRFLFMAAVLTTPILAVTIRQGFELESDEQTIPAANAFMVVAAVVVIIMIFPSEKKLTAKLQTFFPMQSIAQIQPSWRTFNADLVGGMMTFQSKPDFIDSRFDVFEHHGVLADYLKAMYVIGPLEVFEKYRIDHVLLSDTMPASYLLKHTAGWTIIRREKTGDDIWVTFARTPGAPAGSITDEAKAEAAISK